MDDRELLELAAKAAGIEIYESTDGTIQNRPVWVFSAGGGMGTMPYEDRWNPLIDDAQALRLAVKLEMEMELFGGCSIALMAFEDWADHNGDPYAATRRAIVRLCCRSGLPSCWCCLSRCYQSGVSTRCCCPWCGLVSPSLC